MNLDQLRYIVEVSKERSLTKAAQNLHVSTPAISRAISLLEKELGITIFNRSRQGATPTLDGKKIIKSGLEILQKTAELYEEFSPDYKMKSLKIGCGPALTYVIYEAFLLFNNEHHNVDVEIVEMDIEDMLEALKGNKIDTGFSQFYTEELQRPDIEEHIESELLFSGHTCLCVSKHSHLYHKDFLTVDDIRDEKFVLYNSARAKAMVEQYLQDVKFLFTSNNIDVLRSAVISGHAILFVHNHTFSNHPDVLNGNLAIIPLKKSGSIDRYHFWGVRSKSSRASLEAMEFQKMVVKAARK
ncbi:LysR family transcriptional regulator [Metabacillus idriensis]|uniref:LysR family transcriptional regulator n=1 Tax=Metabacillus idriensis TaxID=324768 RepID=UPI002813D797|nr:LysR family transcriptional regulator [Metabacillus idriensis]MDR0140161.1 LysR family transcriptional regulator [Metabacillus idriensis]